jgi:hypothetical protein
VTPGSGCANCPFGEISKKHRSTLVGTLRKIDGSTFAAGNSQVERRAGAFERNIVEPACSRGQPRSRAFRINVSYVDSQT